jgi:sugar O-acyltransferase (sialic acid O-acetyltransferase NeuD family)
MAAKRRVVVLGAAGQAREVDWIIRDLVAAGESFEVLGYVVSDPADPGEYASRDRILGDLAWLFSNRSCFDALALGVGMPQSRLSLASALLGDFGPEWWPSLVHPSVVIDRSTCSVGHGVLLAPGTVVTVNAQFAPFSMANFGSTFGHETRVGSFSVIQPGANIAGGVEIGAEVLVGTGAQILQYRRVGDRAVVGAGAVVTKDVVAGSTVVGVPARAREESAG